MSTRRTPPLYTRGRYTLAMPWQADPAKIYTCTAIRSFSDLYERDIDVYTAFYEPMNGIGETEFQNDKAVRAAIITLEEEGGGETIYVPDTYITSFPNMGEVQYSHMVLSISFGALPDFLDLTFCKTQMANKAGEIIGVTPTVEEHRAPSSNVVTPSEHETAEANRVAAIQQQETDYARANRLETELAEKDAKIATLEQILIDNGLI